MNYICKKELVESNRKLFRLKTQESDTLLNKMEIMMSIPPLAFLIHLLHITRKYLRPMPEKPIEQSKILSTRILLRVLFKILPKIY